MPSVGSIAAAARVVVGVPAGARVVGAALVGTAPGLLVLVLGLVVEAVDVVVGADVW